MSLHREQPALEPHIEETWVAALADAAVDPAEALLYAFDGDQSSDGYRGWAFPRGRTLYPNGQLPELDPLLPTLNQPECIDAYRIAMWTGKTPEAVAAGLRHELEHGLQWTAHGEPLFRLYELAVRVLAERVGGLPGGGFLYQIIPVELDANAAAAAFARRRYGDQRINELLQNVDPDSAGFRALVGPGPLDQLPGRMVRFFTIVPDLCEAHASRRGFGFEQLLDLAWQGSGAIYADLVNNPALQPR
jgi:hypothetical protein